MKFKLSFLTIFLVAGAFVCVNAQDRFGSGFYIKATGDTVVGIVRYQNNYTSSFDFKLGKKAKKQRLTFDEAVQFGFFNGPMYSKLDFGTENLVRTPVFAKVLVNGAIKLIRFQTRFFIDGGGKNRFMLAKNRASNAAETMKNHQTNSGYFNILFNDCSSIQSSVKKTTIQEESLIRLLKDYNTCKNEPFSVNKWTGRRIINFGFQISKNITNIRYANINDPNYKFLERSSFMPYSSVSYGAVVIVQPLNPSSILSLQNELIFSKGFFEGNSNYEYQQAGYDLRESSKTSLAYSLLSYKIGPRISFRSNSLNPYVASGISIPVIKSVSENSTRNFQINDVLTDTRVLKTPVTFSAFWMSVGVKKKIAKKHFLFFEATYDLNTGSSSAGSISGTSTKFGFLF